MRDRRTNFASFDRARVQSVWSGRLTHDRGSVPSPFSRRSSGVSVEDSDFFARTFDGVVAWGLFFLLDAEVQRRLIKKIAGLLQSGGRLLFTAPNESGSFPPDVMTGRPQFSLGYEEYRKALEAEGVSLVGTNRDEGENHYYFAQKM